MLSLLCLQAAGGYPVATPVLFCLAKNANMLHSRIPLQREYRYCSESAI
jgi:hypothetical protein